MKIYRESGEFLRQIKNDLISLRKPKQMIRLVNRNTTENYDFNTSLGKDLKTYDNNNPKWIPLILNNRIYNDHKNAQKLTENDSTLINDKRI